MVSVRLPEDLVQRLSEVGNEEGLSLSDTIRVVLERGLSAGKRRRSKK
jgi:metal-responsive CopG/Arc/MetJ family transcriptional regulator